MILKSTHFFQSLALGAEGGGGGGGGVVRGILRYIFQYTQVWASYTIQIAVLEFSHMDSKLWDGNYCDLHCSGPCNSTFHFCFNT